MSGDFVETNRQGIYKETNKKPGNYESGEGGMVMVPEVSGLGGFGGPGEYKKYPKVKIKEYDMDEDGLRQTGEKELEEVDFLSSPPKEEDLRAPGEAPLEVEEISPKKKRRKKKADSIPAGVDKEQVEVTFQGSFGEVSALYEGVFKSGISLVLISNQNTTFSYTPPQANDAIVVTVGDDEYEAYSIGVSFVMPDSNKKVTVLLVDEDD